MGAPYIYDVSTLRVKDLTFILLTRRKWLAPNNASGQQMGFNSGFKGLTSWACSIGWRVLITICKLFGNCPLIDGCSETEARIFHSDASLSDLPYHSFISEESRDYSFRMVARVLTG